MTRFIQLLARQRAYRLLWLGNVVSLMGDWLSYIAVALLAIEQGGGAIQLALVFAAHVMPEGFVAPLAGVIADRYDRRRVLMGARAAQALVMVVMVAAALAGSLLLIQLLLLLRTVIGALGYPAHSAALRELVPEKDLIDANALQSATWSVTFAFGMAIGGVVALAGPTLALLLDAGTFVVAALLFSRLPSLIPPARTGRRRSSFTEIAEAWRYARSHPALLEAMLAKAPVGIAFAGTWLLLNLSAAETPSLGSAAITIGIYQAVRGVGSGVGPVVASRLSRRRDGAAKRTAAELMRLSSVVSIAAMAVFALTNFAPLGLVAAFAWGAGSGGNWVFSCAELQRLAPRTMIGRIASMDQLSFMMVESFTAIGAALIIDVTGKLYLGAWLSIAIGALAAIALHSPATWTSRRGWQTTTPTELAE